MDGVKYEPGKVYPLEQTMVMRLIQNTFGIGLLMDAEPDYARGRRFIKDREWEFWLVNGKRVSISLLCGGGMAISVSNIPDADRPDVGSP